MKIRIFPSHADTYNSITIETDDLVRFVDLFNSIDLPSIFLDDVISDLINLN